LKDKQTKFPYKNRYFEDFRKQDYARAGFIATETVELPEGKPFFFFFFFIKNGIHHESKKKLISIYYRTINVWS